MIACKPTFPPYLNALLPQDQIFDPEDLEYDHKVAEDETPPKKRVKSEKKSESKNQAEDHEDGSHSVDEAMKVEENQTQNWDIDNPYLAATKLPAKGE